MLTRFKVKAPPDATSELDRDWVPLIPLVFLILVQTDVPEPPHGKITEDSLNNEIVELIDKRLSALMPLLLRDVPSEPLRLCLEGVAKLIELLAKARLRTIYGHNLEVVWDSEVGGTSLS